MDSVKQFKNSPEIREYGRVHKQQQRAKKINLDVLLNNQEAPVFRG